MQRCDFGSRKIDFLFQGRSLAIRYSDGGAADPVVDVLDLLPGEAAEAGVKRLFSEAAPAAIAARCVLARAKGGRPPADVRRWTFVPDSGYRKELAAKANPNEVGDPPCGERRMSPDGIQFLETFAESPARRVLFVRVGQDEPLFDENSLRLLPPARTPHAAKPASR